MSSRSTQCLRCTSSIAQALEASGRRRELERVFERIGFLASSFTNSDSQYQYYNLANLRRDIETTLAHGLAILNVCSEPWRAGDLHAALAGAPFVNAGPPVVREDVRTEHAGAFARAGPYLYDRAEVLRDLQAFVAEEELLMRLAISNIAWKPQEREAVYAILAEQGVRRAGDRPGPGLRGRSRPSRAFNGRCSWDSCGRSSAEVSSSCRCNRFCSG